MISGCLNEVTKSHITKASVVDSNMQNHKLRDKFPQIGCYICHHGALDEIILTDS